MAEQTIGGLPWNHNSFSSEGKGGGGPDRWMRLKPGSNPIRVLTLPYQYYQHKYKAPDEKGFGNRIPCSAKHGSCAVCAKGDRPKKRWYLGVIDRGTNSYKILDVSWSVLSDIQTYADDADWGDPTEYDFDIVVNPHGGAQNYYKAVAKPKRPLSASDMAIKERDVDLEFLQKRCAPPEPQFVEQKLAEVLGAVSSHNDKPVTANRFDADEGDFKPAKIDIPF